MAHGVTTNAYLLLSATEVSTYLKSLQASETFDLPDDTCMGDTYKQRLVGVGDYQLSGEFNNDYVDNLLDEVIEGLKGTNFAVAWRPVNTTIAAGNPEYQFTGSFSSLVKKHTHGQPHGLTFTIMLTTSAGVTRDITP